MHLIYKIIGISICSLAFGYYGKIEPIESYNIRSDINGKVIEVNKTAEATNYKGVVIKIDKYLKVGAKISNRKLFNFAKKHNLAGFEFLAKLPGSIGGSVKMNAGMKSFEISDNLVAINGIDKSNFKFNYRETNINIPIFEVWFEIKEGFRENLLDRFIQMRKNQPNLPSLGSAFKNPQNDYAGRLIEAVSLKGVKFGDVGFSEKHANFLVNYGNGKCKDVITALNEAKRRVFEEFGIKLEEESKLYI